MVPPLGKITSFFRPYVTKKPATEFDGDNIVVAARAPVASQQGQAQGSKTPALSSLERSISPRRSSKTVSTPRGPRHSPLKIATIKQQKTPRPHDEDLPSQSLGSALTQLPHSPSLPPQPSSETKPTTAAPQTVLSTTTTSKKQETPQPHTTPTPTSNESLDSPLTELLRSPSVSFGARTATGLPRSTAPAATSQPALKPTSANVVTSSFSSNSSRRVVVNGIKGVTNSDSESPCSSDDELDDFASFMPPPKRQKVAPPGSKRTAAIVLPDDEEKPSRKTKVLKRTVIAPKRQYRHSLLNLVQQIEKDEASTARIKQAEADVEEQYQAKTSSDDDKKPDMGVFDDDSDPERIKAAISRIEAFDQNDVFYFFHGEPPVQEPNSWPTWKMLAPLLHNDAGRELVITSKFLTGLASQIELPEDVLEWVYRALQVEPSEVLCEEYLSILQAASVRASAPLTIGCCSLRDMYDGQVSSNGRQSTASAGLPKSLKYNLRLLASLSGSMSSFEERATALFDLFLLNLDEHVRTSMDTQLEIASTMQVVLEASNAMEPTNTIQSAIGKILGYDLLTRQQMARGIASLPATSSVLHQFRRQLALHYMLKGPSHLLISPTNLDTGRRLQMLLHDPFFATNADTDWNSFHWTVNLVDICIDAGFSDFAFLATDSSIPTEEERSFNEQVDQLAQRLRFISNRIRDAGTSQLRRAEAKSALDRLVIRIELSVRTRPKRKAAVFGGMIGVGHQDVFKQFLSNADSDDEEEDKTPRAVQASLKKSPSTKTVKFEDRVIDSLLQQIG